MTLDQDSESVLKTVDVQQSLIARMAASSSTVKNWCVTLATAVVVFAAEKDQWAYLWLALVPILLFAALDIYYLTLEKQFRARYESFIQKIHGSAVAQDDLFVVRPRRIEFSDAASAACSLSIWPFYVLQILALVVATVILNAT
ncbi:hypothetical protein [Rhodopirellula europaea]|uniref:hypothetical protein n=1 Tax=Rhodopirellula europaea TaxID=1263866 RepID=UPI003D27E486